MNIAITIWGNRISPVFDASRALLVAKVKDGQVVEQKVIMFNGLHFDWVEKVLRQHAINVRFGGAICEIGIERLETLGIEVKPFVTGKVNTVLRQFTMNGEVNEFAMPGCRVGGCCRRRSNPASQQGRGKR